MGIRIWPLDISQQGRPRLQYNQGESHRTLTIEYQQYGSPHGQTHSARHDLEGARVSSRPR